MANIGASRPYYAKYRKVGNNVQYFGGGLMGKLVNFNVEMQANDNNNDFYADNAIAETQRGKFSSGTLTVSPDDLSQEVSKDILGVSEQELPEDIPGITDTDVKELVYDDDLDAPYLGIGMVQKKQVNNVTKWRAIILAKVMFDVPPEAAETEGESINWQVPELSGTIMRDDSAKHRWKREATFTTEEQAMAYIRYMLNIPTSTNAKAHSISIGSLVLTPTFSPDTTTYTATTTNVADIIEVESQHELATIVIEVNEEEVENGDEIPWETGSNTVEITITAEDGTTTKTYTITVTKS